MLGSYFHNSYFSTFTQLVIPHASELTLDLAIATILLDLKQSGSKKGLTLLLGDLLELGGSYGHGPGYKEGRIIAVLKAILSSQQV